MTCEEIQDLVALAALGDLDGAERQTLDTHLQACPECRTQLDELTDAAGALAYLAPPVTPPEALRARVLARVRPASVRPTGPAPVPVSRERWLMVACSLLALGLVASLVLLGSERQQLAIAKTKNAQLVATVAQQQERLAVLKMPDMKVASLSGMAPAPGAQARLFWSPQKHAWLITFFGLPPLKGGKTYQLWAVTPKEKMSMGTLGADPNGSLVLRAEMPQPATPLKAVAVSIEPAGGMPQPTGPIALMGTL
jgi:anti-sigma-K factor RskA